MWELYRKDDGLLQRFLRHLQTSNIVPLNIRFVHDDRIGQTGTKLLDLWVMFVIVILPTKTTELTGGYGVHRPSGLLFSCCAGATINHPVRPHRTLLLLLPYRQMLL